SWKKWGKLRNCQAKENGKALQGKAADPAKWTKFDEKLAKLTAQATAAAIACRYGVNGGRDGDGLRHGPPVGAKDRLRPHARQGQRVLLEHPERRHDAERVRYSVWRSTHRSPARLAAGGGSRRRATPRVCWPCAARSPR